MKRIIFSLLLVCFLFPAHPASGHSDAKLQAILDQLIIDHDIIGAVAMVKAPDGTIYSAASGSADDTAGGGTPMSTGMYFRVASVSKMFTATVALKMQEAGLLSLNDTLATWNLPNSGTITIRHLLGMRAGLSELPGTWAIQFMGLNPTMEWTQSRAEDSATALASPGTAFNYINRNSVIANLVCSAASPDLDYRTLLSNYILTPLGITHNLDALIPTTTDIPTPYARAFAYYDEQGAPSGTLNDVTNMIRGSYGLGAFGMTLRASDILTFLDALFDGGLLTAASLNEMKQFQATDGVDTYGLGLRSMMDVENTTIIGHDGGGLGHNSLAVQVNGYELVILTNGCRQWTGGEPNATARTLMEPIINQFGLLDNAADTLVPTTLMPLLLN